MSSASFDYDEIVLNADEIDNFTEKDLINNAMSIFDADDATQIVLNGLFIARAAEIGCVDNVKRTIDGLAKQNTALQKAYEADEKAAKALAVRHPAEIERDRNGRALQTIENICRIMLHDPHYAGVRYNLLRNAPEVQIEEPFELRRWSDTDSAESLRYIEEEYNIYSAEKHNAALRLLFREREYNPITDALSTVKWDGIERCENFLCRWAKSENTPYVREVSRLIFAGGIWRLMQPGCKFDDVPILIGAQGCGKSSLCRFLAVNDDWFGEVKDVEGQNSIEQLQGKWICEIQELAAMTKAKEVEAIKAYITRQRDNYRKPYDKEPSELLRRCIFIGTSNNRTPLIDKSGNRRFYPVEVHSDGYEVFDSEREIRDYALQCWAEAYEKYLKGDMPAYAKKELREEYRTAQEDAVQDDWRTGAIKQYLDTLPQGYLVCSRELAHKALSPDPEHPKDPSLKDSKEIGEIMAMWPEEWVREEKLRRTEKYGPQRVWRKISGGVNVDDLPF